jgi:hypothetical protein
MVLGGRRRTALWAAAGILAAGGTVVGCGDDDYGGGDATESPTRTATTASPSPTGNRPSDPAAAEKQIRENWQKFFDPATPIEEKRKYLQDGDRLYPNLRAFSDDPRGRQVGSEVKTVTFTSATGADVTYTLTLQGATALPDAAGTSVLQDDVWKISAQTFCSLIRMSGGSQGQSPGC